MTVIYPELRWHTPRQQEYVPCTQQLLPGLALKHISIPSSWLPFQPNKHKLTTKVKVKHQHKHSKEGTPYIEQVSNHHRLLYMGSGRVCMSLGWLIIISNRHNTGSILVHSRTRQLSLGHRSEKMILTALPVEWAGQTYSSWCPRFGCCPGTCEYATWLIIIIKSWTTSCAPPQQ